MSESGMKNVLLDTIKEVLEEVHIETGRKDDFERVCNDLESAISAKILAHEIDYYSESLKA